MRSADVGVSGIYEVISEADLAFTPDTKAEAVTVFRGRIREEVVYGICLPMPGMKIGSRGRKNGGDFRNTTISYFIGFSILFVVVAVSAVVAALVAGSLLYRYQLQKEAQQLTAAQHRRRTEVVEEENHHHHRRNGNVVVVNGSNGWTNWMPMRLLRPRVQETTTTTTSPSSTSCPQNSVNSTTSNHSHDG